MRQEEEGRERILPYKKRFLAGSAFIFMLIELTPNRLSAHSLRKRLPVWEIADSPKIACSEVRLLCLSQNSDAPSPSSPTPRKCSIRPFGSCWIVQPGSRWFLTNSRIVSASNALTSFIFTNPADRFSVGVDTATKTLMVTIAGRFRNCWFVCKFTAAFRLRNFAYR